jgi:hypothetical protein
MFWPKAVLEKTLKSVGEDVHTRSGFITFNQVVRKFSLFDKLIGQSKSTMKPIIDAFGGPFPIDGDPLTKVPKFSEELIAYCTQLGYVSQRYAKDGKKDKKKNCRTVLGGGGLNWICYYFVSRFY